MTKVTLEQIRNDLMEIKKDIKQMKSIIKEDFELADDVTEEINESRKKPSSAFISHEGMRKEFG